MPYAPDVSDPEFAPISNDSHTGLPQDPALQIPATEPNYMSYWLEAGFSPTNIPSSLF